MIDSPKFFPAIVLRYTVCMKVHTHQNYITAKISLVLQIGFTALHWAIQYANHAVIDVLLQCGASLTTTNKVRNL